MFLNELQSQLKLKETVKSEQMLKEKETQQLHSLCFIM